MSTLYKACTQSLRGSSYKYTIKVKGDCVKGECVKDECEKVSFCFLIF